MHLTLLASDGNITLSQTKAEKVTHNALPWTSALAHSTFRQNAPTSQPQYTTNSHLRNDLYCVEWDIKL